MAESSRHRRAMHISNSSSGRDCEVDIERLSGRYSIICESERGLVQGGSEALGSMESLEKQFAENRYAVYRSCVADPQLSLLYRYACRRAQLGTMKLDDTSPSALSAPGDVFMDGLLIDLLPLAETVSQLKLFPTFSYFRVYHRGDVLARHTDRPACEIGLTLCLGYDAKRPWPIMIECSEGPVSVELARAMRCCIEGLNARIGETPWRAITWRK